MPSEGLERRKRHVAWAVMTCSGITKVCASVPCAILLRTTRLNSLKCVSTEVCLFADVGAATQKPELQGLANRSVPCSADARAQNPTALKQHGIVLKASALETEIE